MKTTFLIAASLLATTAFADDSLTLPFTAGYFGTTPDTTTAVTSAACHKLQWDTSADTGINSSLSDFMVTFTMGNLDAFTDTSYKRLFAVMTTGTTLTGLGISMKKDGDNFMLSFSTGNANGNPAGSYTLSAQAGHVYSFAHDSTGTTAYLLDQTAYAASKNFSTTLITFSTSPVANKTLSANNSAFYGNAPMTVGAVTNMANAAATTSPITFQAAMVQAYNASVPEPATATLSLLALAGLAARRRRH